MIEAIILSTFAFISGILVGAFVTLSTLGDRIKKIKLDSGAEIHVWKGFVDPSKVFVAVRTGEYGDNLDGDGVVFDKKGNIIFVESHVEAG